jgi:replication factor C small subunit
MESPLWIDRHAPALAEIPQDRTREFLQKIATDPMNVVLHGPPGCGKTAAVRAYAAVAHDDPENDFVVINLSDFFDRSKKEIREDPRFEHFLQGETEFSKQYRSGSQSNQYKRDWSKRDMVSHILSELASYAPSSGDYRTLLLDNAESIREDFQQALRRVMERHHEATQFVITTRQPAGLLAPIRSRCVSMPMRSPNVEETVRVLDGIAESEGVDYDADGLDLLARHAGGNLRAAIIDAQTTAAATGEITRETVYETVHDVGHESAVEDLLETAAAGKFDDARDQLDTLLIDEGLGEDELLAALCSAADAGPVDEARFARLLGDVDYDLADGATERVHFARLLAAVGTGEASG